MEKDCVKEWQKRVDEIACSREASERLWTRYFEPFKDVVGISGVDGVQYRRDGDFVTGIDFPQRYSSRAGTDVCATQHEMGHFVTISEDRSVMPAFGFATRGVPDLQFRPWERIPVKPMSHIVEAKAIAWELIFLRDLHGISPPAIMLATSLKYATDFHLYPGRNEDDRLEWAVRRIEAYVREFGDLSVFDRLWEERCRKLPLLLERERIRTSLWEIDPISSETISDFVPGWNATIEVRSHRGVEQVSVTLEDGHDNTFESFPTMQAAEAFLDLVKSCFAPAETTSTAPRGSM